jgi:hypothetical protein
MKTPSGISIHGLTARPLRDAGGRIGPGIYIFGSPASLLLKVQDGTTSRATAVTVESGYALEEFAKR